MKYSLIWYLIVQYHYSGGVVAIPQLSREQCIENVRFLKGTTKMDLITCIPGASRAPGVAESSG